MGEAIAIVSGILLIIWMIYFCTRISKMETAVLPCKKCGKPAPIYLNKTEAVKRAENIFGGEAIPIPLCWNCRDK